MKLYDLLEARMSNSVFEKIDLPGVKIGFEFEFGVSPNSKNTIEVDFSKKRYDSYYEYVSAYGMNRLMRAMLIYAKKENPQLSDHIDETFIRWNILPSDFFRDEGFGDFEGWANTFSNAMADEHNFRIDGNTIIKLEDSSNYQSTASFVQEKVNEIFGIEPRILTGHNEIKKNSTDWYIEEDSSIENLPVGCEGVELVSPPIEGKEEALSVLKKTLNMISKIGETNDTCGLHIGISCDNFERIDLLKFILFYNDKYVSSLFDRETNTYAVPQITSFMNRIKAYEQVPERDYKELTKTLQSILLGFSKYTGVNIGHHNYLELRSAGNEGYEYKFSELSDTINRAVYCLSLALDENAERKEYLKKLGKLMGEKKQDTFEEDSKAIFGNAKYADFLRAKNPITGLNVITQLESNGVYWEKRVSKYLYHFTKAFFQVYCNIKPNVKLRRLIREICHWFPEVKNAIFMPGIIDTFDFDESDIEKFKNDWF